MHQILINGQWIDSDHSGNFQATNPQTNQVIPDEYPVSNWQDCDAALDAAVHAFWELKAMPSSAVADFLEEFADRIEQESSSLVEIANAETGLPKEPRLASVELPRTTNQLRQAATAARSGEWARPVIDTAANIRSVYEAIGPVAVFGPNNFPFAFNSLAGGDFASAIAAGNPVIGKSNSSHPGTTRRFAELAQQAAQATGMPNGLVQLIYRTNHADGERLVADKRLGATGYTGSRSAGLKLKSAADAAGNPIYLELSSVNPVVILPGALRERPEAIVDEFVTSGLMGTGQFCTNPGLLIIEKGKEAEAFIASVAERYRSATPGTLLSPAVENSLVKNMQFLLEKGAELVCGAGGNADPSRCCVANTVLRINGSQFLNDPESFQTEVFGNAVVVLVCDSSSEISDVITHLEGNLTGCIYSDSKGSDDEVYRTIAPRLAFRVGRLLNDKMPTGVAVSPAMNHGGPYPATGHPGFTAVGIPAAMLRFAKLTSYDNVRAERLPANLQDIPAA